jgi:hydrogenase expression/formation protein HypC
MCLAIPGKVNELLPGDESLAVVEVAGVRRRVNLSLVQDESPAVGDWVLIHVGFAMSKISADDAVQQARMLAVLGEDAAAMEEARGYGLDEPAPGRGGTS